MAGGDPLDKVDVRVGEDEGEEAERKKGKGFALPKWASTAGILAGLGAAAFGLVLYVVKPMLPPPAPAAAEGKGKPKAAKRHAPGKNVALEPVVVNIAGTEGKRYLKATVQAEVPDQEKIVKEVTERKPQLADILVTTLSRKTLPEVTAPDALAALRGEIFEKFAEELGPTKLHRVFITEFVIQ
jgi:flagellar basal body-associated protein FliL